METKKHAIISLFSVVFYLHRVPNRSWGIVGFIRFIFVKDLDQVTYDEGHGRSVVGEREV